MQENQNREETKRTETERIEIKRKETKRKETGRNNPICPFCGSRNIAAYLWGMPAFSEELERAIDEGEIILGGCCISDNDPSYYCRDCKKSFGRPPVFFRNKDPQTPEDLIGVDLEVGGYFGGYDHVMIRSSGEETAICVSNSIGLEPWPLYIRTYTRQEWNALKKLLFDQCFIHEWKRSYDDPYICDGTQWEVTLKFRNGKKFTTGGSNAFPGTWDKLDRYVDKCVKEAKTVPPLPADLLLYAHLFRDDSYVYSEFLEYINEHWTVPQPPNRDQDTYAVCFVAYYEGSREYTYLDSRRECCKGDLVRVPVGNNGDETVGRVTAVGEFTPENMPYPFEKMKAIIGTVRPDDEE